MAIPLTDADKAEIDRQLANLKEAEAQIKRAEAAGIDVSEEKARMVQTRDQLLKIKQAYFPTGR